ncbi:MAG: hypothetical protein ACSHX6_12665 [Akkermansiaceae bacterium]
MKILINQRYHKEEYAKRQCGFALIATISMMVLLMMIALAMLSLSTTYVRTSHSNQAVEEAQQNARVSLMMAIGQLQSLTGPDTRVTGSSRLLSETNVAATGVWRSWEGTDHENTGKPKAPDYDLKMQTGDPNAEPSSTASDGRFLGWLGSTSLNPSVGDLGDFSKTAVDDYILMLGEGGVMNTDDQVYVKPTYVDEKTGAVAWWTCGNNSKAMINVDRVAVPSSVVEWQQRVRSNGRADSETFGLEKVDERAVGARVPTRKTLGLVDSAAEIRKFHDLTTYSRGLLTNTATGGWRKDLSLLTEQYDELPDTELASFTLEPGNEQTFSKAQDGSYPPNPLIYPWTTYHSSASNNQVIEQVPAICSWTALVDYSLQYRNLTSAGAARTSMPIEVEGTKSNSDRFDFQDKVRRVPQLARLQWIYSLCSQKIVGGSDDGKYNPGLMVTPVVTVWNPYNVELDVSNYRLLAEEVAPLNFTFRVGDKTYSKRRLRNIVTGWFELTVTEPFTLAPGATRIFGLSSADPVDEGTKVDITPGYTPGSGFMMFGINNGKKVVADAGDTFDIESVGYDGTNSGSSEISLLLNIYVNENRLRQRMSYTTSDLGGQAVAELLYPQLIQSIGVDQVMDVEGRNNLAFASSVFGYRMANPISTVPEHRHLFTKGMLQANPLNNHAAVGNEFFTETGVSASGGSMASVAGTGAFHPANAPFDFAFLDVQGWNDTRYMPQLEISTNSSYIVSGVTAGDGLTRCVMAELPTRPLLSLGQLQHFDARNNNPVPPFQFNLIGNGSAHPIFGPEQLAVPTSTSLPDLVNDDTYMLNHLLFDDWFFSSIAPDLDDFGKHTDRDYETVYEDHFNGIESLTNRFYLPARSADENAVNTVKDEDTGLYTYQTIASQLEVDGMFNINSVSVDAWKAILSHNRDAEVPYLSPAGATASAGAGGFPYPRTSIAGDKATDSGSRDSNATNGDAAYFAGYTALTDVQIDALAEEIVKEIRKRGPFLSLSEFVNRQVTSDKDLAIASTIQKALDNLADSGSSAQNPFAEIQSRAVDVTTLPPGNTDYKFPEAALGSSAFGVPGWMRQADILMPLAPILSARDDTFTIRAYGDARDKSDSTKILATAWCEATVQRRAAYLDPADKSSVAPYSSEMTSEVNKRYGRRYEIVSFRWLSREEI